MGVPTPYTRSFSFDGYQASNPKAPLPGPEVDNELDNVAAAMGSTQSAVNDIRRSDGKLKNGIVTVESLSPEALAYMTATTNGVSQIYTYAFTATEGQTNFIGTDLTGQTVDTASRVVVVLLNGVELVPTADYTIRVANDGITLVTAARADDRVTIRAYENMSFTSFGDEIAGYATTAQTAADTAEAAVTELLALGSLAPRFATRTAFVNWNATADVAEKAIAVAAGRAYAYDGGTTISDLPGWYPLGAVTPEHFGADNTGVSGAQTAINAALAYLNGLGGGNLWFNGTYLLTGTVRLFSYCALRGQGLSKIVRGGDGFAMIQINDGNNGPRDWCTVEGFEIDGKNGTYTGGSCISIRGTYHKIRDNYIHDSTSHGVALAGSLNGTYVSSGTTTTVTLSSAWTLSPGDTVHLQFEGTVPDDDYTVASVVSSTVFTVTTGASYTESGLSANLQVCDTTNNLIEHNRITNSHDIGISLHTSPRNTVQHNQCQNNTAEGITIDNESFRCLVLGNWLVANGGSGGIGSGNSDMSRFIGNYIDNSDTPTKACIQIGNAAGDGNNYVISGNTLVGSDAAGVWLKHDPAAAVGGSGYFTSSGVTITGNAVLNCAAGVRIDVGCNNNVVRGNSGNNSASRSVVNSGAFNLVDGQTDQWLLRHNAGLTNVTGDGTLVTVPFDTTNQSNGDILISGGVVTVLRDGYYTLSAGAKVAPGSGTTFGTIEIIPGGSGQTIFGETSWGATIPNSIQLTASGVQYLTANTTLTVQIRVGGGSTLNSGVTATLSANYFSGARIA